MIAISRLVRAHEWPLIQSGGWNDLFLIVTTSCGLIRRSRVLGGAEQCRDVRDAVASLMRQPKFRAAVLDQRIDVGG